MKNARPSRADGNLRGDGRFGKGQPLSEIGNGGDPVLGAQQPKRSQYLLSQRRLCGFCRLRRSLNRRKPGPPPAVTPMA